MYFPLLLMLVLVLPLALTFLAWRTGLQTLSQASSATAHVQLSTWPAMLFLVIPVVVALGFVSIQIRPLIRVHVLVWMLFLGGGSSVAALVSSIWTPRNVRPLALIAAVAWVVCFGLAFMGLSALAGLR